MQFRRLSFARRPDGGAARLPAGTPESRLDGGAHRATAPGDPVDAAYTFTRGELAVLALHLRAERPYRIGSLGSPAELRSALEILIGDRLAGGGVEVRRSPGALHTAEAWHVILTGVPRATKELVDDMVAEARTGGSHGAIW